MIAIFLLLRKHLNDHKRISLKDYRPLRHRNECTGMALVPRKCGVYKLDQESYKMCTITLKYIQMLILTHTEVTNAMPTVHTTLDYGYRHKNKRTLIILVPGKCAVYK